MFWVPLKFATRFGNSAIFPFLNAEMIVPYSRSLSDSTQETHLIFLDAEDLVSSSFPFWKS